MSMGYPCPEASRSIHHEAISQPTGFFSATLLPHLRKEERKQWDVCLFSVLLWRCRKCGGGHRESVSEGSLAGPALWSLPLWCSPACWHRTVCENVSFQDSPRGVEGQVFLLPDPQFFWGFLPLLSRGLNFASAILTNDLLFCSFSCFPSSPAKAKLLTTTTTKSPLLRVWRKGESLHNFPSFKSLGYGMLLLLSHFSCVLLCVTP